jgi:NitT/TauT family transport system substrate-binding protein
MLAVTLAACGSNGSAGGSTTDIIVGTSGATGAYGPIYVGVQEKVFQKHGLNVKVQTLTPNSVTAAVLSGNIQVAFDGPNLVSGILSNPSAKIYGTAGPTVFFIYGKKGLSSVNDLKGRTVAVTTPGGSLDTAVRGAITNAGMKPGTDVKIAYLQTNSAALAAVVSGSVAAAGVSPPTSVQASQAGLLKLANITDLAPDGLMAINTKFASSNKAALTKFIAAFKEATQLAISNNADSNTAIRTYVKITDKAQLDGVWEGYKAAWTVAAYPPDQMTTVLKQLASSNPPVKGAGTAKLSDIIDNQFF